MSKLRRMTIETLAVVSLRDEHGNVMEKPTAGSTYVFDVPENCTGDELMEWFENSLAEDTALDDYSLLYWGWGRDNKPELVVAEEGPLKPPPLKTPSVEEEEIDPAFTLVEWGAVATRFNGNEGTAKLLQKAGIVQARSEGGYAFTEGGLLLRGAYGASGIPLLDHYNLRPYHMEALLQSPNMLFAGDLIPKIRLGNRLHNLFPLEFPEPEENAKSEIAPGMRM